MPVVAAVEDGEVAGNVELEPLVGWECPDTVVEVIGESGDEEDDYAAENEFADED